MPRQIQLPNPSLLGAEGFSLWRIVRLGEPFIWLAGTACAVILFMILVMLALVLFEGAAYFWPRSLEQVTLKDGTVLAGVLRDREVYEAKDEQGRVTSSLPRFQLMVGNRDLGGADFVWVDSDQVVSRSFPKDLLYLERQEWGPMIAYGPPGASLDVLRSKDPALAHTFRTVDGTEKEIPASGIVRVIQPNQLGTLQKVGVYLARTWEFMTSEPRESNTEGGVFPAIFGTVMMSLFMSILVVPFGVIAALYLREYAKQGPLVSAVRIAVNNLAGVPSIVFGVFGLGFFVYGVGGGLDRLFYADALPTPTFGTGGILWASLTLALLTVPVVIVATEESLAFVPRGIRDASLACGASKWQMIRTVVLPATAPGILTGVILSMARGAGEVAPLMITGVVKLAPELPVDGEFPFFHLQRKFMHLGFHIYDVGFQSPNVEAAMPMVYTTTLLLIAVIVALNLAAMLIRNRLRKRYRSSVF